MSNYINILEERKKSLNWVINTFCRNELRFNAREKIKEKIRETELLIEKERSNLHSNYITEK